MSGPTGHWSPAEDDALHELPWGAQILYLRALRRFVARDGIVGRARRVSVRQMIELLTVPDQRGRHRGDQQSPTRDTVRHLLGVLRRAGLVEPLAGPPGHFVFRLPLAPQGESVPRMSARRAHTMSAQDSAPMSAPMSAHMSAPDEPNDYAGLRGYEHPDERTHGRADEHPDERARDFAMSAPQQSTEILDTPLPACSTSHRAGAHERARDATTVGELCRRLRLEAHMLDANPHRAELTTALADGIEPDVMVATAVELAATRGNPPNVGYLVATVRGRLRDASQSQEIEHGATGSLRGRMSVCDAIEAQDREQSERERERAHLAIVR